MKILSLALASSFLLFACGSQKKDASEAFGRTGNKQQDPISANDFKKFCSEKKGVLKDKNTVCVYTPAFLNKTAEQLQEDFRSGVGIKVYDLADASPGAYIWGNKEDGQTVSILVNGVSRLSMTGNTLEVQEIPAGTVQVQVPAGNFKSLSVTMAECMSNLRVMGCQARYFR